ncbi:YcxB family protein [Halobacillus litoralis]|uniref:YcxB family protein n=1 Tax=Halobacillus litoralis TaxID=45668 RepID=UPI001CFCA981|nr:YcxB family protein [Halobacillus litoralis]
MSSTDEVKVSGILKKNEYKLYHAYYYSSLILGLFTITLILFGVLFYPAVDGSLLKRAVYAFGFALVPAAFVVFVTKFVIHLRSTGEYTSDQLNRHRYTYTINDEGISLEEKQANQSFTWKDLLSFHDHPRMFLVYVTGNNVLVLPKRYFETNQQIESFVQILTDHSPYKKVRCL